MFPIAPIRAVPSAAPSSRPRRVLVLGATGSIGGSALDVLARNPHRFQIWGLTAHRQASVLDELAVRHRPRFVALSDPRAPLLSSNLSEQLRGPQALEELAAHPEVDTVVVGLVGVAAIPAVMAAVRAGKHVALANKESVVCAGRLLSELVRAHGAPVLPVDSEHSALFQALAGSPLTDVAQMTLTASGGPFLSRARHELSAVTPEEAVRHPRWNMGAKVSVDSATLMNKALELMEAHFLFGVPEPQLEVLIHPQSIVHSLVAFRDGSTVAQLGLPDMRTPIAYALSYPAARLLSGVETLNLATIGELRFQAVDSSRFSAIRLAREALRAGGIAPAVLTVSDEVAVESFLARRLPFDRIERVVHRALEELSGSDYTSLADLLGHLERVRMRCAELVALECRTL